MRGARQWLALGLCLCALEARAQPEGPALETALASARALAAAGAPGQAAARLAPLTAAYPEDFALWLEVGRLWLAAGAPDEAVRAASAAVAVSEGAPEARLLLTDALGAAGRWREALGQADALLAVAPAQAGAWRRRGLALSWLQAWDEARAAFRRALALEPGDAEAWLGLAWAAWTQARDDEAGEAYAQALAVSPGHREARLGLAWVALRAGRDAEARAGFEAVLADVPGEARAREGLAALGPASTGGASAHAGLALPQDAALGGPQGLLVVAAGARLADRVRVEGRYRRLSSLPWASATATPSGFAQDEGHVSLAWVDGAYGLALHAGAVSFRPDVAWPVAPAHSGVLAGVSGRWRAWAELTPSAVLSWYDDGLAAQAEVGARLPLLPHLTAWVAPRLTVAEDGAAGALLGELEVHGGRWRLAAGGAWGTQRRPVDLGLGAMWNVTDPLTWAARARAELRVAPGVRLYASYDFESSTHASTGLADSGLHRAVVGVGLSPASRE